MSGSHVYEEEQDKIGPGHLVNHEHEKDNENDDDDDKQNRIGPGMFPCEG